jgi:hypothetical protein
LSTSVSKFAVDVAEVEATCSSNTPYSVSSLHACPFLQFQGT